MFYFGKHRLIYHHHNLAADESFTTLPFLPGAREKGVTSAIIHTLVGAAAAEENPSSNSFDPLALINILFTPATSLARS